jgi:glucose uptake protein
VILPQTYLQSLLLMIASMICLASWAATFKMTGKWRFELYYLDFAFGAAFAAVIYICTVGSLGFDGFSFVDDMLHAQKRFWIFAFGAGIVFNLANMLLLAAVSVSGMAMAFPVGLGVGLIVGIGVPQLLARQGHPQLLFVGLTLMGAAMVATALAHSGQVAVWAQAILKHAQETKKKHVQVPSAIKGIILAAAAGLLMAAYLPLLARSRAGDTALGPYSSTFLFTMGLFFSTLLFTAFFANLPVQGEPLEIADYFKGRPKHHLAGFAGGVLWCTGMLAALVAAAPEVLTPVGTVAKTMFTYGVPLLAALLGMLGWREFRDTTRRVRNLGVLTLLLLAAGIALVSLAPMYTGTA